MTETRTRALLGLLTLILTALATPAVVIPAINRLHSTRRFPPTYLPALEGPRERARFEETRVSDLRILQPGYVVIGDSMAGTRIDERRLGELAGTQIAPLLQPGSGSAFWYLALKNWVIASGIKPRMVIVFFRDTNLTDVMFRLDQQYRWALDLAALDREPELNGVIARAVGPLHRVHALLGRTTGAEEARQWLEPGLLRMPVESMFSSRRRQAELLDAMNVRLGFDHLRPMQAADIQIGDAPRFDFEQDVERSVLPLMLRDAKQAGLTLCFVRVQRRPTANRPPPQSAALLAYVRSLRDYVTKNGGIFHDDTGDPALTIDMYEDGDHLARHARRRYTENFYNRLRPHFQ
jgi:hypothetical protein